MSVAVGPAPVLEDVGSSEESLRAALAVVLEENRELRRVAAVLCADNAVRCADNAELRERDAEREQELERLRADLAVLQRLLFGRSSERSRPESNGADAGADADADTGDSAGEGAGSDRGSGEQGGDGKPKRGPGARAGRRDYSHLPRFEMFWDFPDGQYCCPQCGELFTPLGDHVSGEQLDWQVIVRVVVHCRRRYKRTCRCRVPATVMAPGPPKAIGKSRRGGLIR